MREETIPSLARLASIREQVRLREEEREDIQLPSPAADARIGDGEEPVAALNAEFNHIFQPPAPDNFLHPGRISIVHDTETDYQRVFDMPGLSRQSSRISDNMIDEQHWRSECAEVLVEWFGQCIDFPERHNMLPRALQDQRRTFDEIFMSHLPADLRWSNDFVRDFLLDAIIKTVGIRQRKIEHFVENDGSMGDGRREARQHASGGTQEVLPFLGIASPGHLIYKPPRGVPVGETMMILQSEYEEIRSRLYSAEKAMIVLAQRITRWVIKKIVYRFVVPESYQQGRTVLDREQVNRAAEAVLGLDWFKLPYDRNGALWNWSIDQVFPSGTLIEVKEDGQVEIYKPSHENDIGQNEEASRQPATAEPRLASTELRVRWRDQLEQ